MFCLSWLYSQFSANKLVLAANHIRKPNARNTLHEYSISMMWGWCAFIEREIYRWFLLSMNIPLPFLKIEFYKNVFRQCKVFSIWSLFFNILASLMKYFPANKWNQNSNACWNPKVMADLRYLLNGSRKKPLSLQ